MQPFFMEELMYSLLETKNNVVDLGIAKVNKPFASKIVLSFAAGAMISFGFLAYLFSVRDFGPGLGTLIGATLFPVGLIIVLIAGGELITGNMMVVGASWLNKKVTTKEMLLNWLVISFGNVLGAVFVSWIGSYLGMYNGLEEALLNASNSKIAATTMQVFVSGMMANWFVGIAVWMNIALKDGIGKIFGSWFPIVVFVYFGFQHSVANTFLLTANKLVNGLQLSEILGNLSVSYLGNILGALIFVSGIYTIATKD